MKKTITKVDIVEAIYQKIGGKRVDVKRLVDDLIEIMKEAICSDRSLLISGFGRFEAYNKKERRGRNPQTEEPIILDPRVVCVFRISKKFKKELNPQQ